MARVIFMPNFGFPPRSTSRPSLPAAVCICICPCYRQSVVSRSAVGGDPCFFTLNSPGQPSQRFGFIKRIYARNPALWHKLCAEGRNTEGPGAQGVFVVYAVAIGQPY